MSRTIGFVGLGVMGQAMAKNLALKMPNEGGKALYVYDVDTKKAQNLADVSAASEGAKIIVSSLVEIGRQADIIFLSLPSSSIVREVVLGAGGLAEFLKEGSIIVDTSTTEVETVKTIARELEKRSIAFADTPVSGGEKGAIDGTLSFMAGGSPAAFETIKPYIEAMASSVVYMGEVGAGQTAKAVNQMIVGAAFAVIAESFSMGVKNGLDPKVLYNAIKGGWAGSKVLDVAAKDIADRQFTPGGTVNLLYKDLGYAMSLSRDTDSPVPLTSLVYEMFKASRAHGDGGKSQTVLVRLWEDLLNIEVK
ncbi:MAG: prephenate dehydrogenase/arogenate dehydrogenase family protein [Treponema sp.]|jgi:2-hydroxy-3-oxopropionate reductase|nr:prephenate dehydrogenase/arogenate dehydrogenase family protein [Treponema sp.]